MPLTDTAVSSQRFSSDTLSALHCEMDSIAWLLNTRTEYRKGSNSGEDIGEWGDQKDKCGKPLNASSTASRTDVERCATASGHDRRRSLGEEQWNELQWKPICS
jgi:hypothetical protein